MSCKSLTSIIGDDRSKRLRQKLLHDLAAKAVKEEDPWGEYDIPNIPAERVIRHMYNAETQTWSTDEAIVKIESTPFTHGAMRFCYRMKMLAQSPNSLLPNRFHSYGWKHANNFVAKAYMKDGEIDVSEDAKLAVQNDIKLQHESEHWAKKFNLSSPPKSIMFIQAYAVEFPDRPGCPWMPIERFISGKGAYGGGFIKHNTNSGFVDKDLFRITPQLFSAHSFYASEGERLVVDIQGVGDLYTDPQVLSSDYRFGAGDLGPRGMALFFKSFEHSFASEAMGIPPFHLLRTEVIIPKPDHGSKTEGDKSSSLVSVDMEFKESFAQMECNRLWRASTMQTLLYDERIKTITTSNETKRSSPLKSMRVSHNDVPHFKSNAELDAEAACLERAKNDLDFDDSPMDHSVATGLDAAKIIVESGDKPFNLRGSTVRKISTPMTLTELTKTNLGRVHYQLAILHGMGRFEDEMPDTDKNLPHDALAVLFHLSYAAALRCAPACLAIARVQAGLDTVVSDLIKAIIPVDFEAAKVLLRRTMESPCASSKPKAAAGCLLLQIYHDEEKLCEEKKHSINDTVKDQIITETLKLMEDVNTETKEKEKYGKVYHSCISNTRSEVIDLCLGDRVEANYNLEGTYYSAVVIDLDGKTSVQVRYDDDGSTEKLERKDIRLIVATTVMQTSLGGPLSDDEAFGVGGAQSDDKILMQTYDMKAELALIKEKAGDVTSASRLYSEAAEEAIVDGKMSVATKWSLKVESLVA